MNRALFQKISELRLREARTLLKNKCYSGAYYLIGYAVECAFKACIAKQVKEYDFPDKKVATEAFTHDLEKLSRLAGLATEFEKAKKSDKKLELNWAVVKDWSEESRYESGISRPQADDIMSACIGKHGVLLWIKKRW